MGVPIKYTDEEIIEWMKPFKTRSEIRSADIAKYQLIMRRPSLREHLPIKLTKDGNVVGTYKVTLEERRVLRELKKLEKERLREEKRRLKEEKKRQPKVKKVKEIDDADRTSPKHMYNGIKEEGGTIICGRCLKGGKLPSRGNFNMCQKCYNRYIFYRAQDIDHNMYNIRDAFCNTQLTHHEKVFEIGVRVDERTEKYLTMVGYGFMFKDVYNEDKYEFRNYK